MAQGYGQVSEGAGRSSGKGKRILIIGISSLILVAMVVAVAVGVNKHENGNSTSKDSESSLKTSSKSVHAFCATTDFKQACKESLSNADITSDPYQLIKIAFNSTINKMTQAVKNSTTIKELTEDPRSKEALDDCKELLDQAIEDLKKSFRQIGHIDITKVDDVLADLRIWLSAAVTYQETCLDGFQNTTSHAGEKMRKALNTSMQLTSNALAIASELHSLLSQFSIPLFNRRLLSGETEIPEHDDGFPTWVTTERRGLLSDLSGDKIKPNVVVAKDGSGKYKTINEALQDVPKKSDKTFIIHIKEGIYKEYIMIEKSMRHVMFIGDGPTKTKITGNRNFVDGISTFRTATVAVTGDYFIAKDIGFENSAGPEKHQAVALRVSADMTIFYNCQIDGYQDTLYAHTYRQFYRDCTITGTIDFIFGDAAVVFQNCTMMVRKPMENQQCIVTAQGRKDKRQATGIVLQDCNITADPTLYPQRTVYKSYLGRPWKEYSRTIIMYSHIDDLIDPEGWLPWMGDFALNTCFYAEIKNKGPGASKTKRVEWKGVKKITSSHATTYTADRFIKGNLWIKHTGVPYTAGLKD